MIDASDSAVATLAPVGEFADLRRMVKSAGLLTPRPVAYARTAALVLLGLIGCWVAFAVLGTSWWQLLVAAGLGIAWTQVGFLGHDVGHYQVFRGSRAAEVLGLVTANLSLGLSFGWWNRKHNAHHAHPNDLDRDPDVGAGALVYDAGQAGLRRGLGRWVTRHQGVLFLPMLLLEGVNLQVSSLRAVLSRRAGFELSLLVLHHVTYLLAVLWFLPLGHAVAFLALQQGVFGLYLGLSFAPNHKGMPLLTEADRGDHLRTQVLTARNVRGGPVVDRVLGGLNYQIEHHLFPTMPRHNLRAAQPMVQAFCARAGVPYAQCGWLASYAQALRHLHAVGARLRSA